MTMNIRNLVRLAAGGALCGALAVWQPLGAQPAPYTIDVILPLTGAVAFSGQAQSRSLIAMERMVNDAGGVRGQHIHFDLHDDQGSPQVAVELTNAAIARHAQVILGSGLTASCAAIGALVEHTGPVQYCLSPGFTPAPGSYCFAIGVSLQNSTRTYLDFIKSRGFTRLAYVSSSDATGLVQRQSVGEVLQLPEYRDIEIVAEEKVNPSDLSASTQVAKIKAARPDVIMTMTAGTAFGTLVHGLADAGVDVPMMSTTANANRDELRQFASYIPHYLYFTGYRFQLGAALKDPAIRTQATALTNAFTVAGAGEPSSIQAATWDAGLLAVSGLRRLGPSMTADKLKSYLLSLHGFQGVLGAYDFRGNQRGLDQRALTMVGWQPASQDYYPAANDGGRPARR
jgi:branched-chain amino acid transport system substrate-binding protein